MSMNPKDDPTPEDSPEATEALEADDSDDFEGDLGDAAKSSIAKPILGPP